VKPPINEDLFNEVFMFVVARKQRATMDGNPSSWGHNVKNITVEFKK
jgi:hypothetical protein